MSSPTNRPRHLIVVAGTGTEVGKTWVSVELIGRLRANGWMVAACKPAQSVSPGETTDAHLLAAATDVEPDTVCPPNRTYLVPMAPPMAAEVLGLTPPTIAELAAETAQSWPDLAPDLGLVELAGGVASPMGADGDGTDFVAAMQPDVVVLVADAGLGTINSIRLSAAALAGASDAPIMVVLNRFRSDDDLHRRNLAWLADRDGFVVATGVDELATLIETDVPTYCGSCGKISSTCDGTCRRPLDPDRFCVRCGRRLVVSISPVGHQSRCRVHGQLA